MGGAAGRPQACPIHPHLRRGRGPGDRAAPPPPGSNARHTAQWENTLAAYAHPVIGNKTVDSITPADAMAVLTPIWTTKPETASRVRQRMETVMDWAITHGYRLDNPAGRSLLKVLPPVKRLKEHRQALPYAQVPDAMALIGGVHRRHSDQAGL